MNLEIYDYNKIYRFFNYFLNSIVYELIYL